MVMPVIVSWASVKRLRDAEVGDLHPAARAQEHVARLDVPVDDAPRVGRVERVGDLLGDARRGRRGSGPRSRSDLARSPPVDQLHDDVRADRILP